MSKKLLSFVLGSHPTAMTNQPMCEPPKFHFAAVRASSSDFVLPALQSIPSALYHGATAVARINKARAVYHGSAWNAHLLGALVERPTFSFTI